MRLLNVCPLAFSVVFHLILFSCIESAAQQVEWGKRLTGNVNSASIVATVPSRGAFVCGHFFEDQYLNPEGYIFRYDAQGNVIWDQRLVFENWGAIINAVTDSLGNLYLIGHCDKSVLFNGTWMENTSPFDYLTFLAKYSADGAPEWIVQLPDGLLYYEGSFAADSQMNLYVFCQQYVFVDPNSITVSDKGSFVLKYDRHGSFLDEIALLENQNVWSHMLAIDNEDNLVISGEFYDTIKVGETVIRSNDLTLTDAFVAKFDRSGEPLWSKNVSSGAGRDFISALVRDGLGNIYLTVNRPDGTILSKYNERGDEQWDLPAKYEDLWLTRAQVDDYGNVYLAGTFKGSVSLGDYPLSVADEFILFLAKLNSSGDVVWAVQSDNIPRNEFALFYDISLSSSGELYLVGDTYSTSVVFGSLALSETTHDTNSLIFKLRDSEYHSPTLNLGPDTFVCDPDVLELKATGFGSYTWSDGSTDSVLIVRQPGEYYLEAKDFSGKVHRDTIVVADCRQLFIPNVITINGDEWNENFEIRDLDPTKDYHLKVFNRLGQVVYANNAYRNNWNAPGLSSGVYFYELRDAAAAKSYKGWIQVIR